MEKRKLNMLLWPVALLLLNGIWNGIADNSAPYEINDYDHPVEERSVSLASVFGLEKDMPSELYVEFKGISTSQGNVSWIIVDANGDTVSQWSGTLEDTPRGWSGKLSPGDYRVQTTVDEGILAEQTLEIQPFKSYQIEGHVLLSCMLILAALGETLLRKKGREWAARKSAVQPKGSNNSPFKRRKEGMPEYEEAFNDDDPWRTPKGLA